MEMEGTGMISDEPVRMEGKKLWQYLAASAASFLALGVGTALAWTAPVLPKLEDEDSWMVVSKEEGSWVSSLLALGAMVGAYPAGAIADKFGRKIALMSLAGPFLVSWAIIILSSNVWALYVARFIVGISVGASCVLVPMYISEIAETSTRGTLGALFQLFLTIGIVLAFAVGSCASYTGFAIVCGLVEVVFLPAFYVMPESPVWLMSQNRKSDAALSLTILRGDIVDNSIEMTEIETSQQDSSSKATSIFHLLRSRNIRKALIAAFGCMAFQQLSGVNAVLFYTFTIFQASGSSLPVEVASIAIAVVQMVMAIIVAVIIDRAGRKPLLLFSSGAMSISLIALGSYFHMKSGGSDVSSLGWLPLTSLTLFMIAFSVGLGPIPWMIMGELFTSETKSMASGIGVMLNWFLVFLVTKTFPSMMTQMGEGPTFWLFAAIMAVATVYEFFLVPETKGKTLQQIQDELNGNRHHHHLRRNKLG